MAMAMVWNMEEIATRTTEIDLDQKVDQVSSEMERVLQKWNDGWCHETVAPATQLSCDGN